MVFLYLCSCCIGISKVTADLEYKSSPALFSSLYAEIQQEFDGIWEESENVDADLKKILAFLKDNPLSFFNIITLEGNVCEYSINNGYDAIALKRGRTYHEFCDDGYSNISLSDYNHHEILLNKINESLITIITNDK